MFLSAVDVSLVTVMSSSILNCDIHVLVAAGSMLLFLYLVSNAIYQLYFSPLSKFPGPKLAAVTLWYEVYYDVFKWGLYHVKVKQMHEKYGKSVTDLDQSIFD